MTGGSKGIGCAYVRALTREGAGVVVADIADGAPIVDEVKDGPGAARYVETDRHVGTKQKVGNKGEGLSTPSGWSWPEPGLHDLTNFRKVDLL